MLLRCSMPLSLLNALSGWLGGGMQLFWKTGGRASAGGWGAGNRRATHRPRPPRRCFSPSHSRSHHVQTRWSISRDIATPGCPIPDPASTYSRRASARGHGLSIHYLFFREHFFLFREYWILFRESHLLLFLFVFTFCYYHYLLCDFSAIVQRNIKKLE